MTMKSKELFGALGWVMVLSLGASAAERLEITTPSEDELLRASATVVVGRVEPSDASVMVNGVVAQVQHGVFLASGVTLTPGENVLTAVASFEELVQGRLEPRTLLVTRRVVSAPIALACVGAEVFGAEGFLRRTGTPVDDVRRFDAPEPGASYWLRVSVGDDAATSQANATIVLNGETLFVPSDFQGRPGAFSLEREVSLALENELSVRLTAGPGRFVLVEVERLTGDVDSPVLSVLVPSEGSFHNTLAVDVRGQALDPNLDSVVAGGLEASLSGGGFEALGVPLAVEGLNEILVVATDVCGNESQVVRRVVRDTISPVLTLDAPAEGAFVNTPVTVTFSASDINLESVGATLDGAPFASGSVVSGEGSRQLVVTARDLAGNATTVSRSFVLDFTAPEITVSIASGSFFSTTVAPEVTITDTNLDSAATVLTLDGAPFSSGDTVSAEGDYELFVLARDLAGNETTVTVAFTLDFTPPEITITGVSDGLVTQLDVTPVVAVTELHPASETITLDGAPFSSGTTVTAEDDYVLSVEATDLAGNTASASVSFAIDRTAPEISISGVTDGLVTQADVTPVVSVTDAHLASETIALNGAAFTSGTAVTGESDYVLTVEATDQAGNTASASVSFAIDRTAPVISIAGVTNGLVTQADVTPVVTVADAHPASAVATLDGAPFVSGTTLTAEQDYVLSVQATDQAGNTASVSVSFAIDRTAPVITITGVTDGLITQTDVIPIVTVADTHPAVEAVTLNGALFVSGTPVTAEGEYVLAVEATDEAGNTVSQTLSFVLDRTPPLVVIDTPADDFLTNQTEIVVSGTFTDATSVSVVVGSVAASVTGGSFTASVPLVEGPNTLTLSAVDAAGNTATVPLTGHRDTVLPSIVVSAPETARRNQEVTLSALATDAFGIGVVRFFVDRVLVSEVSTPPFEHAFVVPPTAASGSLINVRAEAEDLAGNVAEATALNIRVVAGGFVSGEVYDASRGLPLPGATVSHAGGSLLTDARGRFGFFTEQTTEFLTIEREGFTGAERVVSVDTEQGTLILDARLVPLDEKLTTVSASGGSVSSTPGSFELAVPPGALASDTAFRLTEVPSDGLKAPLPLGWSPVGAVDIEPVGASFSIPSELKLNREGLTGLSLVLARYDEGSHAWVVQGDGLTGDTFVSATIDETGAYALVVGDTGSTVPPPPAVDQALLGVEPVEVFFGLSASSEVTPAVSPISPDAMATGSVVLFSPIVLPSGTLVSATVEESFESFTEGSLISQPFTQEMPLYRFPLRSDDEVHQAFPVTPSRALTLEEVREGRIHVSIGTAPSFVSGALVGGEGLVVSGDGGAELVVPAGALTVTVSALVDALDPLELGIGFEGLTLVAAAEVDLSGASLLSSGTLSVPVSLATTDNLFAARFLFVAGQRKLRLIGPASFADGKISTPIDTGGTYLFFQSSEPLALVQGTVTEGASAANLVLVESSTTPFMDITASSGVYVVAAKLSETTLTARSLVTGNQAVATVTPVDTTPVSLDLSLTTTGPFVSQVSPPDGAAGISLAPAITVTFSEPVDPNSVTLATFSLTKADTTPVPGRVIVGAGNVTASFLPDASLDAITGYVIAATAGIFDTTGNALLPFTSSFTTLDDSIPDLNPDALTVSFPDADGMVTVQAPAFSFEPDAAVTILNVTNGIVVTGNVASDGSLFFELRAAITDELQIRVLDSSDREIVIDKTEFQGPNGEVAIGRRGGTISNGEFTLEVPDGALSTASTFTLTPVEPNVIAALPIPEGAGGISSGVEVDMGGAQLAEEADLSFPVDLVAPADASYMVFRKLEESGLTLYEVVDTASVVDGKVTTDSFPFSGVFQTSLYLSMWFPPVLATQKNPMGAIYGITRETDGSAQAPTIRPLPGVRVRLDRQPLDGDYVATSDGEGNFVLIDQLFGVSAGSVNLLATDGSRNVQAVAFTDAGILARFVTLARFSVGGEVVINFPLSPPSPPETEVSLRLFRDNAGMQEEITNGFATIGQELTIKVSFTQPAEAVQLSVNDEPVTLIKKSDVDFEATFTPAVARGYQLLIEGFDAFLNPLRGAKNFLAVQAGAGNDQPLAGPPSIITDTAIPRPDDAGVPVGQVFSVQFTEPVRNVGSSQVQLIEGESSTVIPLQLVGTDTSGGVVSPVLVSSELVALTMTPTEGLKFATDYKLAFSSVIEDLDEDPPGTPRPNRLSPDPTEIPFKTFTPVKLGEAPIEGNLVAMDAIDNRAFVAFQQLDADGSFGTLRAFDLSDPTQPTRIGDVDSSFVGSMVRGIAAESDVDAGAGPTDIVGVISFNVRSGNSDLTLFDVGASFPPYAYLGFVTTVVPGDGANSDIDLHEGFAYVATGTGGLKIIDLSLAREAYLAENPTGPTSIPFDISRGLFTRGVGFGQSSIVRTLKMSDGSATYRHTAVHVADTLQGRRGFVSGSSLTDGIVRFSTVYLTTPQSAAEIDTVSLSLPPAQGGLHVTWSSDIAFTAIDGQELALVTGGGSNGRGTLAILNVGVSSPVLMSLIELKGSWGLSLAVDKENRTAFVGTPEGVEIYNLTNPAQPEAVGTIDSAFGQLAIAQGTLVSANQEELATSTLTHIALIRNITPTTVRVGQDPPLTATSITIQFGVEPADITLDSALVEIFKDNTLVDTLTAEVSGSEGVAIWPADRPVDLKATYFARAVVLRSAGNELRSPKGQMPVVHIIFIDKRGEETFAPPLSDPRPVVTLDPASLQDVTLLGDGRTARVRFSGEVTDALADITPNEAATIREVFVGDQSFPVQRVADTENLLRPFAARGRFTGTATVKIWDGVNPVTVEARNVAGNVGYDSLTVTVNQDAQTIDAIGTGNLLPLKFLDPFTLVLAPTSANDPDSILLAHGIVDPEGTSPLIETTDDSLVFAGTNTQLGPSSVTLSAPFLANTTTVRDSVEAVVSSSLLALTAQSIEFVETNVDSGVFRNAALRLPNNELVQVRLEQPMNDDELDVIYVRLGFDAEDDGTRIEETDVNSATFLENVPGLGNTELVVRNLSSGVGTPGSLSIFLSSDEVGLASYLMSLFETSSGSLRFVSQAEGPASEVVLPTEPNSTELVSVEDNEGSTAGMFEPFWPVARGLTTLEPTDRGFIDLTEIELTQGPLAFRQSSGGLPTSTLREVRSRFPLAFIPKTDGASLVSVFEALQESATPGEEDQPLTREIRIEGRSVTVQRSTGAALLNRFTGIRGATMRLVSTYLATPQVPAWLIESLSVSGPGVTVEKESQVVANLPGNISRIKTTFAVSVAADAPVGQRDVTYTMSNGDTKTFPEPFSVTRGRVVIFAIDGLSWDLFQTAKGNLFPALGERMTGTAFNVIYEQSEADQVLIGRLSTTFAPITFTRWATVFSGATPGQTRVPGQPWFNRQAIIGGTDNHGNPNQVLGLDESEGAQQPFEKDDAYNRFFEVPFIYDDLRAQGRRSIVVDQQAGLGLGNRSDTDQGDDVWDKFNFTSLDNYVRARGMSRRMLNLG